MGLGAVVGAVGAIGGGLIAAGGAKDAANTSAAATDRSAQVQQDIYNQNKATLAPYVATGQPAMAQINNLLGLGTDDPATVDWNAYANGNADLMAAYNAQPNSWVGQSINDIRANPTMGTTLGAMGGIFGRAFGGNMGPGTKPDLATFAQQWQKQHGGDLTAYTTPGQTAAQKAQAGLDLFKNATGYNFRVNEGMNALNSGYAGAGTIKSGAAMKAAVDYGQGMASQEFGNYLNALGNQQGLGFSAASAQAGVGQSYANSLGNIYMQNGANQANASLAKASALGNGLAGVANIAGSVLAPSYNSSGFNMNSMNNLIANNNSYLAGQYGG